MQILWGSYEKIRKSAFDAGMTVVQYKEHPESEQLVGGETEEIDNADKAAAELEAELEEEDRAEKETFDEEKQRIQAEDRMSERVAREILRSDHIERFFSKSRFQEKIRYMKCVNDFEDHLLLTLVFKKDDYKIPVLNLHQLGFDEWKRILELCAYIENPNYKAQIKREVALNVITAHYLKKISDAEHKHFCMTHNIKMGNKSVGLESKEEHPVPSEVTFQDKTYVKTEKNEGLCYIDCSGEECFQQIEEIRRTSVLHCISLLDECKDEQCRPFRKRLVEWMFLTLDRVEEVPSVADKVDFIISEYKTLLAKSDSEMEKLMKYKEERKELKRNPPPPTSFELALDAMMIKPKKPKKWRKRWNR